MRKVIKKLHLYFALILCLPLVLQGLSGALLVFEREILEQEKYVASAEKIPNFGKIIAAAKKEVPQEFTANSIRFEDIATIRFSQKSAEKNSTLEVKIDPISLQILQIKEPQKNFFDTIKKFHTNLLIQGPTGRNIVGSFGLVMLFMAISGLILWWPKRKKQKVDWYRIFTFKFSSEGKKFHRDLHSAVGFWTSIFLLIASFSGVYLAFPQATGNFVTKIFPGENFTPGNLIKATPTEKPPLTIDEVIALAKSEIAADAKLISLNIPSKADQPYRLNFAPKNYEAGEPLIAIFIDPWQKKIIEKRDPSNYKIGEKINSWQHTLHVGQGLGVFWKFSTFLVGFLPLLFSITGIAMWLMKSRKKT